jgi:hypothetical protein
VYKNKEETSSTTVSTEALFLTLVINAQERQKVITIDIPGAFMHSDMDELIHMRLEGPLAELLTQVDPEKYETYFEMENGWKESYLCHPTEGTLWHIASSTTLLAEHLNILD